MPAYSAAVIEHFDHPRNTGRLEPGPGIIEASAGSAAQGTSFHLSARVQAGVATEVRFEAYGCPHCIAAASWATERMTGRPVSELADWTWRHAAVALDVPAEKRGHLLVLEDAVKRLAEEARART